MTTSITNETVMQPMAVDVKQAAHLTGLSPFTIRAYERRGLIKATRLGRRVVIAITEIERFLREGIVSNSPPSSN